MEPRPPPSHTSVMPPEEMSLWGSRNDGAISRPKSATKAGRASGSSSGSHFRRASLLLMAALDAAP